MTESPERPPTLIVLIGPPAVGSMTWCRWNRRNPVRSASSWPTVIDLLTDYFEYGSPSFNRLVASYRAELIEQAAESGLDLTTTGAWRFDVPDETDSFWRYARPYVERRGRVCFVELVAPLETRLDRNLTENRRRHKKTYWSTTEHLRRDAATHVYDSGGTRPFDVPLLRLETTRLSAADAAHGICEHFGLSH
jgi:hypothetical protein